MKKTFLLVIIGTIILLSCKEKTSELVCNNTQLQNPTLFVPVDYKIFKTIIDKYYSGSKFAHIYQQTCFPYLGSDHIKDKLTAANIEVDSILIANYIEKNDTIWLLADSLFTKPIQLMGNDEMDCLLSYSNRYWENYYQKYPESFGILQFSRPGINANGDAAIVEYSWNNNYLAAMGYLLLLDKENDNWVIRNRIYTWAAK
jgi:hypothetical protein